MMSKDLHPNLRATLEFGPLIAFVVAYLIWRNQIFVIGSVEYTGFVVVIAAFVPVFLLAIGALWLLSGHVARMQVGSAILVLLFGGLTVWLNDPTVFKMKPTAIYLALALILGIGLALGQSWLQFMMEDMIPLKHKGWMILTRRVMVLFVLSAAANELVWRTQSEAFWVIFETLVMPVVVILFFVLQIRLVADYATLKPKKKKRGSREKGG